MSWQHEVKSAGLCRHNICVEETQHSCLHFTHMSKYNFLFFFFCSYMVIYLFPNISWISFSGTKIFKPGVKFIQLRDLCDTAGKCRHVKFSLFPKTRLGFGWVSDFTIYDRWAVVTSCSFTRAFDGFAPKKRKVTQCLKSCLDVHKNAERIYWSATWMDNVPHTHTHTHTHTHAHTHTQTALSSVCLPL